MLAFLNWYLVMGFLALMALPLAYRMLPFLHDRGVAFLRPLALLAWGYIFWLLTILKVLENTVGGQVVALLGVMALSAWAGWGRWNEIRQWIRQNSKTIFVVEGLFFVAFAGFAMLRAAYPDAVTTEKPMEMAFINAIARSPSFPPNDPWLSGYAISYYYFGYVLIAMLMRLTGVSSGVAFSLSGALWFAMTATAAYGVLYSLVNAWRRSMVDGSNRVSRFSPLLGPLFVLLVTNFEGFLEVLHARGLFWRQMPDGSLQSSFWSWLKIAELNQPPLQPFQWMPQRPSGLIWWRASRVLQDLTLRDLPTAAVNPVAPIEIIDEFPYFSYLLGDLHPHVLAMPFGLLAISLALNVFLGGKDHALSKLSLDWLRLPEAWFAALALGALGFLNTWDFPVVVGLFVLALMVGRVQSLGWGRERVIEFLGMGMGLGLAGGMLYLPFYLGFDSQAGGFLPSFLFFTRGVNFWVMFGPLLIAILAWLIWGWRRWVRQGGDASGLQVDWRVGLRFTLLVIGGLWVISLLVGLAGLNLDAIGNSILMKNPNSQLGQNLIVWGDLFWGLQTGGVSATPAIMLREAILRRLVSPGTWLTLALLLTLTWGGLATLRRKPAEDNKLKVEVFVLLLILLGVGLTLLPEFFYLRDQFGTRMNTIFKFYFQAWILWALSAAFATQVLLRKTNWGRVILPVVILLSLAYPLLLTQQRAENRPIREWTLDAAAYLQRYRVDEALALEWLADAPYGVIAEAVGGAYSSYARISVYSGLPTVLGWQNHEGQWRGGYEEVGTRPQDIQQLYVTDDWQVARAILQRYQIRYVYVGDLEYQTYPVSLEKFEKNLRVVFRSGSVVIFEVPELDLR
jgi:YYY domain-containing protein